MFMYYNVNITVSIVNMCEIIDVNKCVQCKKNIFLAWISISKDCRVHSNNA